MKTFLFIASALIFCGNFLSCMVTVAHPDSAIDVLTRSVFLLIAVVLFCAAAIVRAIERSAKKGA